MRTTVLGVDIGARRVSVASVGITIRRDHVYYDQPVIISFDSEEHEQAESLREIARWLSISLDPSVQRGRAFVEEPPYVNNRRVLMKLSATYGVVLAGLAGHYQTIGVTPSEWKKLVTGKGNSNKAQVAEAMRDRWPQLDHSSLTQDDIDALAIMQYGTDITINERRLDSGIFV